MILQHHSFTVGMRDTSDLQTAETESSTGETGSRDEEENYKLSREIQRITTNSLLRVCCF